MGICSYPDDLYIVLPYFNFCAFKRRCQLFTQFVHRIQNLPGIRIVVVECNGPSPLPKMKVWKHIKFNTDCEIWVKENLVNLGVATIPKNWKYVAWIDADVTFLNRNWVNDTKNALDVHDVVQLFQTAINLGPNNEALKIDKSFGYMHKDSGTKLIKTDKYGFWHPGYAWACNRKAWVHMHGLLDWAILGSADRHMAYALIGRVLESAPSTVHTNYKLLLLQFQDACKGLTLGYIPGSILHHWHGSFKNRRYKERWEILTGYKYNPLKDIHLSLIHI